MRIERESLSERDIPALLRGCSYNGVAGLTVRTLDGATAAARSGRDQGVLRLERARLDATGTIQAITSAYADYVRARSGHPTVVVLPADAGRREVIAWRLTAPTHAASAQPEYADPIPLDRWGCAALTESTAERPGHTARFGGVAGKVALVTGAAQGFGWAIARGLAAHGAQVIVADLNERGATERAAELSQLGTTATAHAGFGVDVGDERSLQELAATIGTTHGGVDIVVSNAGVVRAGAITELSAEDFAFVTRVNYTGFFAVTRAFAPLLGRQNAAYRALRSLHDARPVVPDLQAYFSDIVQINSKSGLVGSNRNAAYAGSKFGAIGLVQSFALELVEHGIKVNALCPGNFFDGPLWSDPQRGLFAQYLAAGKVPGARTVEDVRAAYEAKVPMGRGCTGADVVRALLYSVDQRYETGQALPITGGQVMLA